MKSTNRRSRFAAAAAGALAALASLVALAGAAAEDTSVQLRIEGEQQTYFDGAVPVGDCTVTDTEGNTHAFSGTAICALEAAAAAAPFEYAVKDFGFGLFLNRIGSDDTASTSASPHVLGAYDSAASTGQHTTLETLSAAAPPRAACR